MLEFEGNFRDLAHVHTTGRLARWEVELRVAFDLGHDESLHRLEVLLVEDLTQQVQDQKALLMRDGAELEGAHHVEHRLNHLLPQCVIQGRAHLHGAALGEDREENAELLHSADSEHASLANRVRRLVPVR